MLKTYGVTSFLDYLSCILTKIPEDGFSTNRWYRGHSAENHELIPSFLRKELPEAREETTIAEFHIHHSNYQPIDAETPFEHYALMQHYQVPTRLLDWSLSPLVALFFALEKASSRKNTGGHVWVLDPHHLNEQSICYSSIVVPNKFSNSMLHNFLPKYFRANKDVPVRDEVACLQIPDRNPRQASQFGAFSIHGFGAEGIVSILEKTEKYSMAKICFSDDFDKEEAYRGLKEFGINRQTVYVDMQHLGERIDEDYC